MDCLVPQRARLSSLSESHGKRHGMAVAKPGNGGKIQLRLGELKQWGAISHFPMQTASYLILFENGTFAFLPQTTLAPEICLSQIKLKLYRRRVVSQSSLTHPCLVISPASGLKYFVLFSFSSNNENLVSEIKE